MKNEYAIYSEKLSKKFVSYKKSTGFKGSLKSIFSRDYPIIMALTLIGTASLVVANLIVDILYVFLDPRIKYTNEN